MQSPVAAMERGDSFQSDVDFRPLLQSPSLQPRFSPLIDDGGPRPRQGTAACSSGYLSYLSFTQLVGRRKYCFKRSVSCCPTYLPISLSNCAQVFHGRYSSNSPDMRGPTPGISRNSGLVPVFRLIGTKALR